MNYLNIINKITKHYQNSEILIPELERNPQNFAVRTMFNDLVKLPSSNVCFAELIDNYEAPIAHCLIKI